EPGRVKLKEFHVFERQAVPVDEGDRIARVRERVTRYLEDAAKAARREDDDLGVEYVQPPGADVARDDARDPALVEDQIEHVKFRKELHARLDRLLIQRLEDHVAGSVRGVAGAPHRCLAEVSSVSTEAALIDQSFRGSAERKPAMLELVDRGDRIAAHDLAGVL